MFSQLADPTGSAADSDEGHVGIPGIAVRFGSRGGVSVGCVWLNRGSSQASGCALYDDLLLLLYVSAE
jgi:hypothetical protein